MSTTIGFLIVSHDKPAQLHRLIRRLMKLYNNPPIACHHDFSKCSLEGFDFPREVSFVRRILRPNGPGFHCLLPFSPPCASCISARTAPNGLFF